MMQNISFPFFPSRYLVFLRPQPHGCHRKNSQKVLANSRLAIVCRFSTFTPAGYIVFARKFDRQIWPKPVKIDRFVYKRMLRNHSVNSSRCNNGQDLFPKTPFTLLPFKIVNRPKRFTNSLYQLLAYFYIFHFKLRMRFKIQTFNNWRVNKIWVFDVKIRV